MVKIKMLKDFGCYAICWNGFNSQEAEFLALTRDFLLDVKAFKHWTDSYDNIFLFRPPSARVQHWGLDVVKKFKHKEPMAKELTEEQIKDILSEFTRLE